jgi:hypothetical protein
MYAAMGDSCLNFSLLPRWRAVLHAGALVAMGAASLPAAAEPLKLYLYKENGRGMPVYSTHPPQGIEYSLVYPGSGAPRPVLSEPPPASAEAETEPGVAGIQSTEAPSGEALVGWAASCKGVNRQRMDERAAPWQAVVNKYADAHGVPAALVHAVIRVESCFDTRAVSRVGARGLMQLMPATAAELGVTDSFDADQNISGGVRYLSRLLNRFENDTRLAIAAYNAGPTAVDAYRGIPPFPQTRSYVDRVLAEYRERSRAKSKKSSG